jgi:endonuclease/exonuclease/phosphatase family metal-dependent hydrolase
MFSLFLPLVLLQAPAQQPESPSDSLRLMSFNIRYANPADGENRWEKRREIVYDLLRTQRPDVIGMQEALHSQITDLKAALPEYEVVGVGRDDGKTAGEYSPLLFRRDRFRAVEKGTFWFSDTPAKPGSTSWGNRLPRICTWARLVESKTRRSFYVYNLHLDHESQPSRERSVALLIERIRDRKQLDPVIVLGDFNAGEDNPAILTLRTESSPPLIETFRALHPEAKTVGTYHGFTGDTSSAKIDYLFVSRDFDLLSAAILHDNQNGRYPSDHFPVTARVRFALP